MAISISQNLKVYSFDSVGVLETSLDTFTVETADAPPIGIKTPISLEPSTEDFVVMHRELSKQIRDNFKNLLLTNHGERLLLSDFGANLRPLAFEMQSEGGITAALQRIKTAVDRFMPFITLDTFEPLRLLNPDESVAKLGARITYGVPSANITNQAIEIVLYSVA